MTKASVDGRLSRATKREIDAVAGERRGERFAVGVGGNARDEGGRRAEPGEADRDIVGRTAEHRVVGVRLRRDRE